jgi:hypothetical protein
MHLSLESDLPISMALVLPSSPPRNRLLMAVKRIFPSHNLINPLYETC